MNKKISYEYKRWVRMATADADLISELNEMHDEKTRIEDAFFRNLEFGTGGLRGIIGAGTNRINIYTIAKASQGLANYIVREFQFEKRTIVISHDSRIKSRLFAEISSEVFAGNGIKVFIFKELMPTPCLSFAVRELGCSAGIMITASHNPAKYNGYKIYNSNGCQITTKMAETISYEINRLDLFFDIQMLNYNSGRKAHLIKYVPQRVFDKYIDEVKKQSLIEKNAQIDKNIPIIYSPLNGTGLKPVMRVLIECGYSNVTIVEEQMAPDGNFPTCPFPNPEIPQTMELGIKYAKHLNAGIVLATDPDCDRVGVFVKNCSGEYVNLTGNEIGILLLDYICSRRISLRRMPTNPIVIKTIVTTDMTEKICNYYGAKTISVLTGFKFIGEQIGVLESYGLSDAYIFGFEESNGFLSGTYVRDKDGVNGVLNICDMYAYYSSNNILLVDKLAELYKRHGYYNNVLLSYEFSGMNGMTEMRNIMSKFRSATNYFGVREIEQKIDYLNGIGDLPKSDMIKYVFNEKLSAVIRPSGTEPKMKIYISSCSSTKEGADGKSALLAHDFDMLFKQ